MTKRIILLLSALSLLLGCGRQTRILLDDVETYIDSRPDSALTVLRTVEQKALRGRETKAQYSLLYAMALDKNYIDTTDVEIIRPAVEWYMRHGSNGRKAATMFYRGVILFNAQDFPEALVAFDEATKYAELEDDYHLLGLICVSQASIYNSLYNYDTELRYARKASDCFSREGENYYHAYGFFRLGIALCNNEEYDSAAEQFCLAENEFKDLGIDSMVGQAIIMKATIKFERDNDYIAADSLFTVGTRDYGASLENAALGEYALSRFSLGKEKSSMQLI